MIVIVGVTIRSGAAALLLGVFGAASVNLALLSCLVDCQRQASADQRVVTSCHGAGAHEAVATAEPAAAFSATLVLCVHRHDRGVRATTPPRTQPGDDVSEGMLVPMRFAGASALAPAGLPSGPTRTPDPPGAHRAARPLRL